MSTQNRLTEDELKRVKLIREDVLQAISSLGELNYQKTLLEEELSKVKKNIIEIKKSEQSLFSELQDKYGIVSINLETGEFNQ
jgi:hypothetical protein